MSNTVVLVSFYSPKSLGLRYLENAIKKAGFDVELIFFKAFNSVNPKPATEQDYELILNFIKKTDPVLVGFSVMASPYMEVVYELNSRIKKNFKMPIVWGGVYASLSPEQCMEHADFVVRGEGEGAIVELTTALKNGSDISAIQNLVYKDASGSVVMNDLRSLITDIDACGIPGIGGENKHLIEHGTVVVGDPQATSYSYEMSASRGCPYACSYCCSVALMRMNKGGGKFVRFREVDKVIEELLLAKKNMKKLKVIHFWDEIFSDDPEWINSFVKRYKKEINLPFEIWAHPLKINSELIKKLRYAGLYKVVMGIQSGSPYIRKEVFHRPESNDAIFKCDEIFHKEKVPQVIYDFMLRHPFETVATIKETFNMCIKFKPPFEIQPHGLSFLPGTDIVGQALEAKLVSPEDMHASMHAPMSKQFDRHWQCEIEDEVMNYWYDLIFLTQFPSFRKDILQLAKDDKNPENYKKAAELLKKSKNLVKIRYWRNKGTIVLKGTFK